MPHALPDPSAHRQGVIAGLRQLADALDANHELPVPRIVDITYYPRRRSDAANTAEIRRIAKILQVPARTDRDAEHIRAVRHFSGVTYRAVAVTQKAKARWNAIISHRDNARPGQTSHGNGKPQGETGAPNAHR